jgi:hypothetical protein
VLLKIFVITEFDAKKKSHRQYKHITFSFEAGANVDSEKECRNPV